MLDACVAVKAKEVAVMLLVYLVRRLGAVAGKSFLWMHLHMQHAKTSAVGGVAGFFLLFFFLVGRLVCLGGWRTVVKWSAV